MVSANHENLKLKIDDLESRLAEYEQLIEAIKTGEVDAFAIKKNDQSEIYTLQTGDYAYRVLIEQFGEGAVNVTEDGLIVYTNRCFLELLDLPYEKVVARLFVDLVQKDSLKSFKELFREGKKGKSKGEINLVVNKKIIPVYVSLTSLQPNLETVGIIITDLTDKKKNEAVILQYQKELEAKNLELTHSNAELASFAYIASHDLQEPLRKIQTFTERLLATESKNFSTTAKDYFSRITSASARMQSLIIALLNYSRLNNPDTRYELTDLNALLKQVKANLNDLISENGVVIESANLPVLGVIPHQIEQLFSNIIINAIKYCKPGVKPLITVDAKEVSDTKGLNQPERQKHWEIFISDNGIGFEQVYGQKIFELFQRLHGNAEFEGTGIGLAICKRIVQNHGGTIRAVGEPGKGATFIIQLPLNK